jgi:peptidase S41-like protein
MPLMAAAAQQRAPTAQARPLDARAVVAEVRRIIAERWVLPEHRPALDAILAQGLESGRYDVAEPGLLAERIDEDLKRVGRDRHLGFDFDPRQAATLAAPDDEQEPDPSAFQREVRLANHGITELRLLPGNVRYMAYDQFMWIGQESAAALDNAMGFLAGGDAIIIDLRRNGGGYPEPTHYLISHFMPANKLLSTFYEAGKTERAFTSPHLPAGRVVGKPLYVLTSSRTASAAEAFAGMAGGHRLGEVVGETTRGAGFSNELVPIDGRFVLSVSTARVVLAATGGDWEAVGISPTIRTPGSQALEAAHVHAIRRISKQAPAQERPRLEALAEGIAARLKPGRPALPLTAYAGTFGDRTISVDEGKLYYQRGEQARTLLLPLGANLFVLDSDPALRVEFLLEGPKARAITLTRAGGPSNGPYKRTL